MKRKKWTTEEIEFLKNNYEVKGAKKISSFLNKPVNSIIKKAKSFGLNSRFHPNLTKEELQKIVFESFSVAEVVRKLNKSKSGDYYKQIKKYIEYYQIDISHFDPYKNNGSNLKKEKKPISFWLQYGSGISSVNLKNKLYEERLKSRNCEKCGQGEMWHGEKLSLILDHKSGDPKDNRLENLQIVCPNCAATLSTHCRGSKPRNKKVYFCKCGKKKSVHNAIGCKSCVDKTKFRKTNRPPYSQLIQEIKELGYCGTGRKYGVSDNAIRKWIKFYEKNN